MLAGAECPPTSPRRSAARCVLAQRTADSLIAEARAEAARVLAAANDEAATTRDSTREMAATMLDEAREEARAPARPSGSRSTSEVEALKARRDFLESDVDHLEQLLVAQRERVRDAATELTTITDRVPAGLGDMPRRPLLSASDDGRRRVDAVVRRTTESESVGVRRASEAPRSRDPRPRPEDGLDDAASRRQAIRRRDRDSTAAGRRADPRSAPTTRRAIDLRPSSSDFRFDVRPARAPATTCTGHRDTATGGPVGRTAIGGRKSRR